MKTNTFFFTKISKKYFSLVPTVATLPAMVVIRYLVKKYLIEVYILY